MFKNKTLLITGGTGSFGTAVLDKFISSDLKEIRILSRDEKKQDDLRKKYNNKKIKFFLGDVRNPATLEQPFKFVDFCFHAAALKQVPSCEFFPMEAYNTNVIGTYNVIDVAVKNSVKKVICLSTDKAVYPINAMGISKAMSEKLFVAMSRNLDNKSTVVCGTRYGNVMASRGSVIPLFLEQIKNNSPITITDPNMTRFMMSIDDAVDLVVFAFKNGKNGDIFVQKSPSATLGTLVEAILLLTNKPKHKVNIIGTRHGEKLYETLLSREEMVFAKEFDRYYKVSPDLRDLNYDVYTNLGDLNLSLGHDYNSHNSKRLTAKEMLVLLKNLSFVKTWSF